MATKTEDLKVLEKVVSMAKRELDPVEYARFLTLITPKTGDSTKELREIRDIESYEEIVERLNKGVIRKRFNQKKKKSGGYSNPS
jgi:hypothetical protein